jgi:ParB-like chromosome segregation protein Spo0J
MATNVVETNVKQLAPETDLKFHELADLFPLIEGQAYDEFKEGFAKAGFEEPVVLHEGKILDGRNRYRALKDLKLPIPTREWAGEGGTALQFVLAKNLRRRHLDSSQRAMIATDLMPLLEADAAARKRHGKASARKAKKDGTKDLPQRIGEAPDDRHSGEAAHAAAEMMGTNRQYVADAKRIKTAAPDLAKKVAKGEMSLPRAKKALAANKSPESADRPAQTTPTESVADKAKKKPTDTIMPIGQLRELADLLDKLEQTPPEFPDTGAGPEKAELTEVLQRIATTSEKLLRLYLSTASSSS